MVEPGSNGSEWPLTLRLSTTIGPVTLDSVYAPTLSSTPNTKDEFYENLASIINSIPISQQGTACSPGRFQCQSGGKPWHMAFLFLPWGFSYGQDEWEWTAITRAVHLTHLLQDKAPAQGFLETPMLKASAPNKSARRCANQYWI